MVEIAYDGNIYACDASETVLEALLRQGATPAYSCNKGICLSCIMQARTGAVPAEAQVGLRDSLRAEGYFLPCVCTPSEALDIGAAGETGAFSDATIVAVDSLAPRIRRIVLEPHGPFDYRAGQFVNVRTSGGLVRSYSLTSVPGLDDKLVFHIKRLRRGRMSTWAFEAAAPGERLSLQGPNGGFYYEGGRPDQPMLLIGNGSGLGALMGVARDAFSQGHAGPVHLYHGSHHADGLYQRTELQALSAQHGNFRYEPCVSGEEYLHNDRPGRADEAALADHADLTGWRVFLCGYAPMVHATKKAAYLAGAALNDIYADPYELRELRVRPRG